MVLCEVSIIVRELLEASKAWGKFEETDDPDDESGDGNEILGVVSEELLDPEEMIGVV